MMFRPSLKNKRIIILIFLIFITLGVFLIIEANSLEEPNDNLYPLENDAHVDSDTIIDTNINSSYDYTSWLTYINQDQRIEFKYPEELYAQYISLVEWPPMVEISDDIFSCQETPLTSSLPNRTLRQKVGEREYCIEAMSEGAAGSVYTTYNYSTIYNNSLVKVTFILRYPACYNYDEPKQSECISERETSDLNEMIDKIVSSIEFVIE